MRELPRAARGWWLCGVAWLAATGCGCTSSCDAREASELHGSSARRQASAAVSASSPRPVSSTPLPPAGSATALPPAVPCRAAGRPGLVSLATIARADEVFLRVRGDTLFALAYHHALARTSLTRVRRDGQGLQRLGQFGGLGPVASFQLFEDRVHFWRKGAVLRVDPGSGGAVPIAERVARPFVVEKRGLFVLRCGDVEHPDELLRVDPRDGEQTLAVMPARNPGSHCGFRYLTVDETTAFVSDWTTRRIYRVMLDTGAVDVLVDRQSFPLRSFVEPRSLVFHSADGLYRVRRDGSELTQLSKLGSVPYSTVVSDGDDFWMYSSIRYTDVHGLYRVPPSGGSGERVPTFEPFLRNDPLHDAGFVDLAVDDQCVYFARSGHPGTPSTMVSILAQGKPPLRALGSAAPRN